MTSPSILNVDRSATYDPVATAGPFPIPFPLFDASGADLAVELDGVEQTGNWTLTVTTEPGFWGAPNTFTNGSITFTTPITGTLIIEGDRAPRRQAQFAEGRGVPARDQNTELNTLTAITRELWQKIRRTVTVPRGESGVVLPSLSSRANKYLGFDNAGNPVPYQPNEINAGDLADGAITEPKHATGGVSTRALADEAVSTVKLVDKAVTNAKLADMPANTIKLNNTGGSAPPKDGTAAEATAMLTPFSGDNGVSVGAKGLVSAPPVGAVAADFVLSPANIWIPRKTFRFQSLLTLLRHSATSEDGTSSGTWAFPATALSANTLQFLASRISGTTLFYARWWVAWNPSSTTASPNGVRLINADSGPSNVVVFTGATFTRANSTSPVVDAVDITSEMQALLAAGTQKTIGHQVVGNGTSGPKIYASEVEIIWEIKA